MTWTFLITIEVPSTDPQSLEDMADDLHADLNEQLGYRVSDVKPWNAGEDTQSQQDTGTLPLPFNLNQPSVLPPRTEPPTPIL